MDIFGIGTSEILFIIIIALIVLGPKDLQKSGRTIGKWLRSVVTSDGWKMFQQTSRELRTLPNRLMRDANEELSQVGKELKDVTNLIGSKPYNSNTPPSPQPSPIIPTPAGNHVAPAAAETKTTSESETKLDA
ncbi:MAG: twin-arginine translocase TatA/TatE family subunit [Chloroflexota bacterium]